MALDFNEDIREITTRRGTVIQFKELSALDAFVADGVSKSPNEYTLVYGRILASIVSINGIKCPPANTTELQARATMLTSREFDELGRAYSAAFGMTDEDLGNELKPGDSQPS